MNFKFVIDKLAQFKNDNCGNIALVFAFIAIPLLFAVGAAVDYARATSARQQLLAAIDAAVLAGAGAKSDPLGDAERVFDSMAGNIDATSMTRNFTRPDSNTVAGTATASVPTSLTAILQLESVDVSVSSAASKSTSSAGGAAVCILLKSTTDSQALLVNSGAKVTGPDCEIHDSSKASPAAIFNSGSSLDVKRTCIAGSSVIQNGGTVSNLEKGCQTAADPFATSLPSVSVGACTVQNQNYSGTNTLSPGVYCGNFNFNGSGTLNLNPGLYVFKGTRWNLNSGWTVNAKGVTFYFADKDSYIQVNSGVKIDFSAPTSGTYANILMFEPTGLKRSGFSINGSAGHKLRGLIYLPSRDMTFNSVSSLTADSITMVFNTLILNNVSWQIAPGDLSIPLSGGSRSTVRLIR